MYICWDRKRLWSEGALPFSSGDHVLMKYIKLAEWNWSHRAPAVRS